jgi:hypothetical protein
LTLFGTPLWFYGTLEPSYKHAADTLYATAAFWFVLRASREGARRREFVAGGLCFALLVVTRYANAGLVAGALLALWALRLRRTAISMTLSAAGFGILFFALPLLRHIPYASPPPNTYGLGSPDSPGFAASAAQRMALGAHVYLPTTRFDPAAPLKMLFTLHRGIFLWTPLTALSTIGFVLLLRHDRRNRPFFVTLAAAAVGLLGRRRSGVVHVRLAPAGPDASRRLLRPEPLRLARAAHRGLPPADGAEDHPLPPSTSLEQPAEPRSPDRRPDHPPLAALLAAGDVTARGRGTRNGMLAVSSQ